jgi:hypothetical protein
MRNGIILTENTTQITIGEKDSSASISTAKNRLFSMMQLSKIYPQSIVCFAKTSCFITIDPTILWAYLTID